jgi:molecular chaperone Hsp33
MMREHIARATACDGLVRALAIDATETVAELRRRQVTDPVTTAALGRTALGALLLGALLKEEDQLLTLRVKGDGPAGVVLATANGRGEVRGLVGNPQPDVPQVRNGKLNVSGAVGRRGTITLTRDLGLRQPYASTAELVSGEIGEDLAHLLARSEQVPSAVGVGVFVAGDGSVAAAGGYLVQILPGLGDADARAIEEEIRALPHPTTMLRCGESPEAILGRILPGGFELVERRPVRFHCPCSRERAERALILLGAAELESILEGDAVRGETQLTCEFCSEQYEFTPWEIQELIGRAA